MSYDRLSQLNDFLMLSRLRVKTAYTSLFKIKVLPSFLQAEP
jgi:hypothetical protein